ncbi:alpha/beta fold hydrolase [Acidithiobacillus sp. IBUN Pt1247-S3]|uniref:alpha/beta fold hydrolase n=1 Tax=Acidithiobacillus sp. IBUN Pt1247-S3 TaxID=3166642 RepID=UPI0034E51BEC
MSERRNLVLLHGWGMERRVFAPWLPMLAEDFTVHTWELPGHGARPCPAEGWQWETELDLLQAHLSVLERPILLGWSLGGLVSLALALRPQAPLSGLVLLAGSPCFQQRVDWPAGIAPQLLDDFAAELTQNAQGLRRRFFALQVLGDPNARGRMPQVDDWPLPDTACLLAGLQFLQDIDLRPALHALDIPVLLLQGEGDRIVPSAAAEYLRRALPTSVLRVLHCGHAPFLSQPVACAQALREVFLHAQ